MIVPAFLVSILCPFDYFFPKYSCMCHNSVTFKWYLHATLCECVIGQDDVPHTRLLCSIVITVWLFLCFFKFVFTSLVHIITWQPIGKYWWNFINSLYMLIFKKSSHIRAVEIPCPTCPTWSHFIQDKLKFSIYLSLDKYKIWIKLMKFCISYFDYLLWIHMLHLKQCGSWSTGFFRSQLIWIYIAYKRVDICMVLYCFWKCKLFNLYYWTSKIFFGQVHYDHLLVPGQVENFDISTPLHINIIAGTFLLPVSLSVHKHNYTPCKLCL